MSGTGTGPGRREAGSSTSTCKSNFDLNYEDLFEMEMDTTAPGVEITDKGKTDKTPPEVQIVPVHVDFQNQTRNPEPSASSSSSLPGGGIASARKFNLDQWVHGRILDSNGIIMQNVNIVTDVNDATAPKQVKFCDEEQGTGTEQQRQPNARCSSSSRPRLIGPVGDGRLYVANINDQLGAFCPLRLLQCYPSLMKHLDLRGAYDETYSEGKAIVTMKKDYVPRLFQEFLRIANPQSASYSRIFYPLLDTATMELEGLTISVDLSQVPADFQM